MNSLSESGPRTPVFSWVSKQEYLTVLIHVKMLFLLFLLFPVLRESARPLLLLQVGVLTSCPQVLKHADCSSSTLMCCTSGSFPLCLCRLLTGLPSSLSLPSLPASIFRSIRVVFFGFCVGEVRKSRALVSGLTA